LFPRGRHATREIEREVLIRSILLLSEGPCPFDFTQKCTVRPIRELINVNTV
jgi:hypothetical protein